MQINLEGIKVLVNTLMVDAVSISRGDRDAGATWDATEGEYDSDPAPAIIYAGQAQIYSQRRFRGGAQEQGGNLVQTSDYWVEIPHAAQIRVQPRDVIKVTAVHTTGDQTLLNTKFRVVEDMTGTYSVSKRIWCVRLTNVPM